MDVRSGPSVHSLHYSFIHSFIHSFIPLLLHHNVAIHKTHNEMIRKHKNTKNDTKSLRTSLYTVHRTQKHKIKPSLAVKCLCRWYPDSRFDHAYRLQWTEYAITTSNRSKSITNMTRQWVQNTLLLVYIFFQNSNLLWSFKCDNAKLLQKYCKSRTLSRQKQEKIWRKLLFHIALILCLLFSVKTAFSSP